MTTAPRRTRSNKAITSSQSSSNKRQRTKSRHRLTRVPLVEVHCTSCNKAIIPSHESHINLNCGCIICLGCFCAKLQKHSTDHGLKCNNASCPNRHQHQQKKTNKRQFTLQWVTFHQSNEGLLPPTQKYGEFQIEKNLLQAGQDPLRYYAETSRKINKTDRCGWSALAFAAHKNDGTLKYNSCVDLPVACTEYPPEVVWSDTQKNFVEDLFLMLHMLLVAPAKRDTYDQQQNKLSSKSKLTDLAYDKHSNLLFRCLYALGYGEKFTKSVPRKALLTKAWERHIKSVFTSADILLHLRSTNPGVVKTAIGSQLMAQNAPDTVFYMLNDHGLSFSRVSGLLKNNKNVNLIIEEGVDFSKVSKYCLVISRGDNYGSRCGGGSDKVGYKQNVLLVVQIVTVDELIRRKIYDQDNPLSRVDKIWSEEIALETFSAETVFGITTEDTERLGTETLSLIKHVLLEDSRGAIPSYLDAEILLGRGTQWQDNTPKDYRHQVYRENEDLINQMKVVDEEGGARGLLSSNNAFCDIPMNKDLAKKTTCVSWALYTQRIQEQVLSKGCSDTRVEGWNQTPVLNDFSIPITCDGDPAVQLGVIRQQDENFRNLHVVFGGFHVKLKGEKLDGALHGHDILESLFKVMGRTTDGKLKFVLNPGDPNQAQDIHERLLFIIFVTAARAVAEMKEPDTDTAEVTAVEVYDHILERCRKYPVILRLLIHVQLQCTLCILDSAERKADFEEFRSASKLLAPFAAVGHATGYVELFADAFKEWHCMSPAKQQIWILSLFAKTQNNLNQFGDRFVEKFVGLTRVKLGKHAVSDNNDRHNHEVRKGAMMAEKESTTRKEAKKGDGIDDFEKLKKSQESRGKLKLDHNFLEGLLYLRDCNVFGSGAPRMVPAKGFTARGGDPSRFPIMEVGEFKGFGKDVGFNAQSCSLLTEGSKRFAEYCEKFKIDGDPTDSRRPESGENGVSLAMISPVASQEKVEYEKERERCVSESHQYLMKWGIYTIKEIGEELKYLMTKVDRQTWNAIITGNPSQPGKSPNKQILVNRLVAARTAWGKIFPTWKDERLRVLDEKRSAQVEEERNGVLERLQTELDACNGYYKIPLSVRNMVKFNEKVTIKVERPAPDDDEMDVDEDGAVSISDLFSTRTGESTLFGISKNRGEQDNTVWQR